MRDSEQEYPPHQPARGRNRRPLDDVDEEDVPATRSRGSARPAPSLLPRSRRSNAIIIGLIAGFLCIAQGIIITVINAPTFHAYETATQQTVKTALAFNIFGISALTLFLNIVICLIAGFIAGKIVVQRRLGFLTGLIAGLLIYGVSLITGHIPGYPGNQTASTGAIAQTGSVLGGIVFALVLFLVSGVIYGLISLFGAWIATRRHPYYTEE